jgi:hypothetical protein
MRGKEARRGEREREELMKGRQGGRE